MNPNPTCPICRGTDWQILGEQVYRKEVIPRTNEYRGNRLKALFDIWAPGQTELSIYPSVCAICGLMIYTPRPDEKEVCKTYEHLQQHEKAVASLSSDKRAAAMRLRMAGLLQGTSRHILLFGSHDHDLTALLTSDGHQCMELDHQKESSLLDLPPNEKYDILICSFILEQLLEPRDILRRLRDHLRPGGCFYAEVPMEIWGNIPLDQEPVSRLNFFTPDSLRNLLIASGFAPQSLKMVFKPEYHSSSIIWSISKPTTAGRLPSPRRSSEAIQFLQPSGWGMARLAMKYPKFVYEQYRRTDTSYRAMT